MLSIFTDSLSQNRDSLCRSLNLYLLCDAFYSLILKTKEHHSQLANGALGVTLFYFTTKGMLFSAGYCSHEMPTPQSPLRRPEYARSAGCCNH